MAKEWPQKGGQEFSPNNHTGPVWQLPVSSAWGTTAQTSHGIIASAETAT